jgi:hypothetical protein
MRARGVGSLQGCVAYLGQVVLPELHDARHLRRQVGARQEGGLGNPVRLGSTQSKTST